MGPKIESEPRRDSGLATVVEVARFLRISRSKVYQLMDQQVLGYVKLGKNRRVKWEIVYRYVEENTIGA